jgi:hypothetical protein
VPLVTLVGASNELPESEELDALYDRFLIRKQVGQVSAAGARVQEVRGVGGWRPARQRRQLMQNGAGWGRKQKTGTLGTHKHHPPASSSPLPSPPRPPKGLTQLLDYYGNADAANGDGGDSSSSSSSGAVSGSGAVTLDPQQRLTLKEIAGVRAAAVRRVKVPDNVIQLVADLR